MFILVSLCWTCGELSSSIMLGKFKTNLETENEFDKSLNHIVLSLVFIEIYKIHVVDEVSKRLIFPNEELWLPNNHTKNIMWASLSILIWISFPTASCTSLKLLIRDMSPTHEQFLLFISWIFSKCVVSWLNSTIYFQAIVSNFYQ